MLKKAGIIATVATAGVLALSPFAFADTSEGNLKNDCTFENTGGEVEQGVFGGTDLVSAAFEAVSGAAANATNQANTGNCNNVNLEDLVDSGSNNETKSVTETRIEDSNND